MKRVRSFFYSLQQDDNRSFYMAFLRIAISIWLLKELCINYSILQMIYGTDSFIVVKNNPLFKLLHIDIAILRNHYIPLLWIYVGIIILNILGIGKNITAFFLFLFTEMFFRMNLYVAHGGIFMCRFIVLYLVFANSYKYFTVFKRQNELMGDRRNFSIFLTNLSAYAIIIHLCIVYFSTALAKAQFGMWQSGVATYYIFSQERFNGTGYNAQWVQNALFVKFTTYYTLFFEFTFPFLVWIKKFRLPLICMGTLLHIGIYFIMMIYGFQIVFILTYGLFFTNEEWFKVIRVIKNKLPFKNTSNFLQ